MRDQVQQTVELKAEIATTTPIGSFIAKAHPPVVAITKGAHGQIELPLLARPASSVATLGDP